MNSSWWKNARRFVQNNYHIVCLARQCNASQNDDIRKLTVLAVVQIRCIFAKEAWREFYMLVVFSVCGGICW